MANVEVRLPVLTTFKRAIGGRKRYIFNLLANDVIRQRFIVIVLERNSLPDLFRIVNFFA